MTKSRRQRDHPFRRTRSDHASETAEDYVEAIAAIEAETGQCRAADLARLFDVSHVTVSKIISRLQGEGLVVTAPYGPIELHPAGRRLAESARKRHQAVYAFLQALGVSEQTARADAEGIEHHVSDETLQKMREFVRESQGRK